jgi:glycosyltransferase involved in cell wall biosynthesis
MRILFIKEKRSATGVEGAAKYLLYLCKYFNQRKINYLILYNDKDQYYELLLKNEIKVKYVKFKINSPKNIFLILRFKRFIKNILKKNYFTHISVHFVGLHLLLPKRKKIPYISFLHAPNIENKKKIFKFSNLINFKEIIKKLYFKFLYNNFSKADLVLCGSMGTKNTAIDHFNVPEKKIIMHKYGVIDYSHEKILSFREEFNIDKKSKVIISVGRETIDKGVLDFCEVAKILASDELKFIFLGGFRDYKFHTKLVQDYGKYVIFTGMREDVNSFYKYSNLHLFLSHREALGGNAILESLSFGLPLVTWNTIGVNEVLINNFNGLMCDKGKIDQVVKSVNRLLNDETLYNKISANCKIDFNEKYSINQNGERILEIFKKSLKNNLSN